MSFGEVSDIVGKVCVALTAAHQFGAVHRDLKPSNLMIVTRGDQRDVVLLDFGIAKLLHDDASSGLTSTGDILGTPNFMAPEQICGQSVDIRADIYSLGCLAYYLLTGRKPFNADNIADVTQLHLTAPVPRPSRLAPVPPQVDALIARCMQKKPDARFESATEVAAAFQHVARTTDIQVVPGMGVHVRIDPRDAATLLEDQLDDIDSKLDLAQTFLTEAGLDIAVELSTSFLAVLALPADAEAEADRVAQVLELVERLESDLSAAAPDLRVDLTVQLAPMRVQTVGDTTRYRGGKLLELSNWAA